MTRIIILLLSSLFVLTSSAQVNSFKSSIDSLIKEKIETGIFKDYPVIVIDGYALIDSAKANMVYRSLYLSDIQSIDFITYDKSSELFGSNNGVLIIQSKRRATKRIKHIFTD